MGQRRDWIGFDAAPARAGSAWWVDDSGRWNVRAPHSAAPQRRLAPDETPGQARFAFGRLGLVRVSRSAAEICIKWDLRCASRESLEAVLNLLDRCGGRRRVRLVFFYEGWHAEVHESAAAAIARIEVLQSFRSVHLIRPVFLRSRPLERVAGEGPAVQRFFETWEAAQGDLADSRLSECLPYLMVYRVRESDGALVVAHAGAGTACAKVFGAGWIAAARGREYEYDGPGRRFSDAVSRAYARVLLAGEPWLDHVRAVVRRGEADPLWVPYQRLLVPGRSADGEPVLVCLAVITERIDIPFLASAA